MGCELRIQSKTRRATCWFMVQHVGRYNPKINYACTENALNDFRELRHGTPNLGLKIRRERVPRTLCPVVYADHAIANRTIRR